MIFQETNQGLKELNVKKIIPAVIETTNKSTNKSTITLITCRNNTNKQIVLIGELVG